MSSPRFSVVIPAYNQARYLADAVAGALAQTHPAHEVIVVDDGSTDDTAEVARGFGDRVHYHHQENRGLARARNAGIARARGDLVAFLDSDDTWSAEHLARLEQLVRRDPTAFFYHTSARCVDAAGRDLPQLAGQPPPAGLNPRLCMLRANHIVPSTVAVWRDKLVATGAFATDDPAVHGCEDWDLWIRLTRDGRFLASGAVTVGYRLHGSSLSADVEHMQSAAAAVVARNFGPEVGHASSWSAEKRIAYGGLYRYRILSPLIRGLEPQGAGADLRRALEIDPSLADDAGLWYELALGPKPIGRRVSLNATQLELRRTQLLKMLNDIHPAWPEGGSPDRRHLMSAALQALARLAYNSGALRQARRFALEAVRLRPGLVLNPAHVALLLRSLPGGRRVLRVGRSLSRSQ